MLKTTLMVAGVALVALVMTSGDREVALGMTLGGGAVLALCSGIAVWVRRTMSDH